MNDHKPTLIDFADFLQNMQNLKIQLKKTLEKIKQLNIIMNDFLIIKALNSLKFPQGK